MLKNRNETNINVYFNKNSESNIKRHRYKTSYNAASNFFFYKS